MNAVLSLVRADSYLLMDSPGIQRLHGDQVTEVSGKTKTGGDSREFVGSRNGWTIEDH